MVGSCKNKNKGTKKKWRPSDQAEDRGSVSGRRNPGGDRNKSDERDEIDERELDHVSGGRLHRVEF